MIAAGVLVVTMSVFSAGFAGAVDDQAEQAAMIGPAPVYLAPDSTRTPLRMLPAHTQVRVLRKEGSWLRVEFRDPQFGPRVGYVEAKHVRFLENAAATGDAALAGSIKKSPVDRTNPAHQPASPARGSWHPAVRGYATYGSTSFAAADALQAVAGSSVHRNVGGGLTVARLWRGVFVDIAVSRTRLDGQRVFVDDGTVYKLGIPLQLRVQPLDVAAGWRAELGRWAPFAGAGVTSLSYRETGGFAEQGDNVTGRGSGALALAGLDLRVFKWVQVGAELRYRRVRSILGRDGVSDVFGEDQLGGVSAGLRLSVGL